MRTTARGARRVTTPTRMYDWQPTIASRGRWVDAVNGQPASNDIAEVLEVIVALQDEVCAALDRAPARE